LLEGSASLFNDVFEAAVFIDRSAMTAQARHELGQLGGESMPTPFPSTDLTVPMIPAE
jgi:hypothetical protein